MQHSRPNLLTEIMLINATCEPTAVGASVRELTFERVLSIMEVMIYGCPLVSDGCGGLNQKRGRAAPISVIGPEKNVGWVKKRWSWRRSGCVLPH